MSTLKVNILKYNLKKLFIALFVFVCFIVVAFSQLDLLLIRNICKLKIKIITSTVN